MVNAKNNPTMKSAMSVARADYGLRLSAFYGALFLILGIHLPFLPVWLDARGLTAEQIAIVTAAPLFLRVFVTPTVAVLGDRSGRHRALVNLMAWLALSLALLLSQTHGFWGLLLVAVPLTASLSTILPLTETIAIGGVRAYGLDYGRMRLWGSLSFVVAGLACGWLIDRVGPDAIIGCLLLGLSVTAVFAWMLPERARADAAPAGIAQEGAKSAAVASSGDRAVIRLMTCPVFIGFLIAAGAVQGAHGMFYAFGALAWQAQGISTTWIGGLWAIAIVGEVALFAYSGRVAARFGPAVLMIAAAGASVVRWSAMAFAPPLAALPMLQLLHALTYGASHLGAMHFISRAVPEDAQGTAQALYATMAMGILIGGATLTSGALYARFGVSAYAAMAGLAAIGFLAALFVRARWTGGALWTPGAPR